MDFQKLFKNKIFTVTEFNDFINDLLTPLEVGVEGEVTEWSIRQDRLIWFSIKDQKQTLRCFSLTYRIRQPIEEGMNVRVFGRPKIFGRSGNFVFDVQHLELAGEGSLKRAFELLRAKLSAEGLFEPERKRPVPQFPQTIGLITSPQAAAYSDFVTHVNARLGGLKIFFIPVTVQGSKAAGEIVAAFDHFNSASRRPDVVVLTRGGGSTEDLQEFNTEDVVRAVFGCKSPVICAIGHEKDVTLAELAADLRASTPTAAAVAAVPDRTELAARVSQMTEKQHESVSLKILNSKHRIQTLIGILSDRIRARTYKFKSTVASIKQAFLSLGDLLRLRNSQWSSLRKLLMSLGPESVLKRGYSIVKKHGKIIRSANELSPGDIVDIRPEKGSFTSEVKSVS